jgi:hypothetical protein
MEKSEGHTESWCALLLCPSELQTDENGFDGLHGQVPDTTCSSSQEPVGLATSKEHSFPLHRCIHAQREIRRLSVKISEIRSRRLPLPRKEKAGSSVGLILPF